MQDKEGLNLKPDPNPTPKFQVAAAKTSNEIAVPFFIAFGISVFTFGIGMALGEGSGAILGYLFLGVANGLTCFFIVRRYTRSAWSVWIPGNIFNVLAAFLEPDSGEVTCGWLRVVFLH